MTKKQQITEQLLHTSQQLIELSKQFKRGTLKGNKYRKQRRWLKKQNKKVAASMAIQAAIGAMQVRMIIATPTPKFIKGGDL